MQATIAQLLAHIKSGRYANHPVMWENFGSDLDEFDTDPEQLDEILTYTFSASDCFSGYRPKYIARLAELGLTYDDATETFTFDISHLDEIADLAKSVIASYDNDLPEGAPDPWNLYELGGDDDVDYFGSHIWVLIETLLDYATMHPDNNPGKTDAELVRDARLAAGLTREIQEAWLRESPAPEPPPTVTDLQFLPDETIHATINGVHYVFHIGSDDDDMLFVGDNGDELVVQMPTEFLDEADPELPAGGYPR